MEVNNCLNREAGLGEGVRNGPFNYHDDFIVLSLVLLCFMMLNSEGPMNDPQ